jgi:replication-associated recombination protein RarA
MNYELMTEGGYLLEEAISALQKEIRRGHEKEAMYWAIEVNTKFPDYLWKRLVVIVTEDIGMANVELVDTIVNLSKRVIDLRKESKRKDYDLCILGFAILAMTRSPKSREGDDFVNEVLRERRMGLMKLDIPDYAIDKHTSKGRKLGRNARDFWEEGARLNNEAYPSQYKGWDDEHGDGYYDENCNVAIYESDKAEQDRLL